MVPSGRKSKKNLPKSIGLLIRFLFFIQTRELQKALTKQVHKKKEEENRDKQKLEEKLRLKIGGRENLTTSQTTDTHVTNILTITIECKINLYRTKIS
jgi:hypothetical protein